SQMEYRPWPHPGVDGPAAGRAHTVVWKHLSLVRHNTDFAPDYVHQPDKFPRVAMAVFHTDDVWTSDQSGKYGDRNFHLVVDRIVIDKKAQLGKHLGDLSVKVGHVLGRLRVIIGHAEQRSIAADVLHELQPLDDFPRIRAGCANEERHALLYRVDGCHSQSLVFVPIKVVALAKTSGGGDHIDPIVNHPVHACLKIVDIHRVLRVKIAGILGRKRWHHRHHSFHILCGYHNAPPWIRFIFARDIPGNSSTC